MIFSLAQNRARAAHLAVSLAVLGTVTLTSCGNASQSERSLEDGSATVIKPWPAVADTGSAPTMTQMVDGPTYDSPAELATRGDNPVQVIFKEMVDEDNEAALQGLPADEATPTLQIWSAEVVDPLTSNELAIGDIVLISTMQGVSPVLDSIGPRQSAVVFLYSTPITIDSETVYAIAGVDQGLATVANQDGLLSEGAPAPFDGLDTVSDVEDDLE